ncbi:MAG: sigma-E factor regulatory protein RseB domain-containing protein [Micromonosporaceae bacterium]
MAVLFLILAPALVAITGAEVLPHGQLGARAGTGERAPTGSLTAGQQDEQAGLPSRAGAAEWAAHAHSATRTAARSPEAGGPGLRLLREAASAGKVFSYEGVQIISWWSPEGATTAVVSVTHEPGQGTLLRTMRTSAQPVGESFVADQSGAHAGDVLGVTEETLGLLAANYRVSAAGAGSACDRRAEIVEARREDGTLAARFWVDHDTKIPLRRELFDHQARMINENTFIDLKIISRATVTGVGSAAAGTAPRPWSVLTAADVDRLRAQGWPLPSGLPDGLTLFDARQAVTPSGPVFHLGYSDGLSEVSLFVQRGGLPGTLAGWTEVTLNGREIYARGSVEQGLTWSSQGHVLTVIADAPASTINAVVRALPHDSQRGFWSRLGHGFGRLVSWIDPFR